MFQFSLLTEKPKVEKDKEDSFKDLKFFFKKEGVADGGDESEASLKLALTNQLGKPRYFLFYEQVKNEEENYNKKCSDYHLGLLGKTEKKQEDKKHQEFLKSLKIINFRNLEELMKVVNVLPLSEAKKIACLEENSVLEDIAEEHHLKHYYYLWFSQVPQGGSGKYYTESGITINYPDDMKRSVYSKICVELENARLSKDNS